MRKKGRTLNIYRVYITLKGSRKRRISFHNQAEASGGLSSLSGCEVFNQHSRLLTLNSTRKSLTNLYNAHNTEKSCHLQRRTYMNVHVYLSKLTK